MIGQALKQAPPARGSAPVRTQETVGNRANPARSGDQPETSGDPATVNAAAPRPWGPAPPVCHRACQAQKHPLTSARLHLEREQTLPPWDKAPLKSISASKYHGPIILFVTTPPHGQGRRTQVTLTVKHAESDWGEQRIVELSTSIGYATRTLHRIGPRRTPWLPGNYLANIEQQGKKLAEISWTVTP